LFRIISILSKFCYFHQPDHVISMEYSALNFRCQCTQQKLQSICADLTFDPQLKKILAFSVKDRYQLNYFICIKDFNAETITSLKLNLFSFFVCSCQHHERKTICLHVYISDIRQIVGYRTPVFIQPFPWHLHITITYNLPHLRPCWRCHNNIINTGSHLKSISDVKTRKRRNVVGIDMIRNNRIRTFFAVQRSNDGSSKYMKYCTFQGFPLVDFFSCAYQIRSKLFSFISGDVSIKQSC
jgi:hypothetical protein